MSLFGGLYVGTSGLKTSQGALNTVAHNLSNINTVGYTRQQVSETDVNYNTFSKTQAIGFSQAGDGVRYAECRRVRHYFLDQEYRDVSGRYSYYEASYSAILEVEDILGELDGAAFKGSMDGLWTAFQELHKNPSDSTYMSLLVSKANIFAENANSVYLSLREYQSNLDSQIENIVNDINAIGARIDELNKIITVYECGGLENANDLRDERDLLLDTLAGYGNITYSEDETSKVSVRFNNVDFVTSSGYYEIGLREDITTGFVNPYWPQKTKETIDENGEVVIDYTGSDLFDLTEEISTDRGTDIGGLRAILLARGDHAATYLDLQPDQMTDQKLKSMQITFNQYSTERGQEYYDNYISKSVIMNVQAEFDNLVHYVATTINQVIADNCDPKTGFMCNPDGTPMQLFVKTNGDPYFKMTYTKPDGTEATAEETAAFVEAQNALVTDENGFGKKYFQIFDSEGNPTNQFWKYQDENVSTNHIVYQNADGTDKSVQDTVDFIKQKNDELRAEGKTDAYFLVYDSTGAPTNEYYYFQQESKDMLDTLYNANSITINEELLQTPAKLGFIREDDTTAYDMGKQFIEAFDRNLLYLNPNATKESTFESCYIDLVSQVGDSGDVFKSLYEFQQLSEQQIEANRQSYVGTSADEELEHMIMYQNAYNAASRYINVINTLLDSVIALGR